MSSEPAVLIIADDLSGAADSAAALTGPATDTAVALHAAAAWPPATVVAVDTDSRYLPGPSAAAGCAAAIGRAGPRTLVYKKIDSTLRGNIGPETAACLAALTERSRAAGHRQRFLAVVAPAFPATGRTVLDGRVRVAGEPLEDRHPDRQPLLGQLRGAGLEVARLPLNELRAQHPEATLAGMVGRVDAVVVDALTEDDLARTGRACAGLPVLLVGSGGLAHQLRQGTAADAARLEPAPGSGPALVCVGSRSAAARDQLRALLDGTTALAVPVPSGAAARTGAACEVAAALERGRDVAVFPDPAEPVDPDRAGDVADGLAAVARAGLPAAGTLVATGGETARAVLRAAAVDSLAVQGEPEPGVVVMRTPGGLQVITKAGSFGDAGTLLRLVRSLTPAPHRTGPLASRPPP